MLSTKGENFSIYCNVTKTQGGLKLTDFFFHSTFVERYTSIGQVFDLITHKMSRIKIWNFCKYNFLGKQQKRPNVAVILHYLAAAAKLKTLIDNYLPPPLPSGPTLQDLSH